MIAGLMFVGALLRVTLPQSVTGWRSQHPWFLVVGSAALLLKQAMTITITETRPNYHRGIVHDLRHLTGRTPHEVIQIGDNAADEIVVLRRICDAVGAVSRGHDHPTDIDDLIVLLGDKVVVA